MTDDSILAELRLAAEAIRDGYGDVLAEVGDPGEDPISIQVAALERWLRRRYDRALHALAYDAVAAAHLDADRDA